MIIDFPGSFNKQRKTVLFDRDGTINSDSGYTAFPTKPMLTKPFQDLISSNFPWDMVNFGIVSNQSGVARNKFSLEDMFNFNEDLKVLLSENGIVVQIVVVCPHHPEENCSCRKPSPLMLSTAAILLGAEVSDVAFVGNTSSDRLAAQRAGMSYFDVNVPRSFESIHGWLGQ